MATICRRTGYSSNFMVTVLVLFLMGLAFMECLTLASAPHGWPRKMVWGQSGGYFEGEDLVAGGDGVAQFERRLRTSPSSISPPTKNGVPHERYYAPPPSMQSDLDQTGLLA
ncbi:hypothetical protein Nepgr_018615 [Nepenthes gracilis]|uniref:Uncharacterized protein n=1 Tax=Nepenthes gracilis TaxID=150966 RepID=A0AAD3STW3_NEPGR|nr:hypothetical protein Nepgr_018615 [Nepenthes gracilis]